MGNRQSFPFSVVAFNYDGIPIFEGDYSDEAMADSAFAAHSHCPDKYSLVEIYKGGRIFESCRVEGVVL